MDLQGCTVTSKMCGGMLQLNFPISSLHGGHSLQGIAAHIIANDISNISRIEVYMCLTA